MELKLNEPLTFGMYEGKTIDEICPEIHDECAYSHIKRTMNWLSWVNRQTTHTLSSEVIERIKHNIKLYPKTKGSYPSERSYNGQGDYGQSSCPGDYMGMGPEDHGVPVW